MRAVPQRRVEIREARLRWLAAHPDLLARSEAEVFDALKEAGLVPRAMAQHMLRVDKYVRVARDRARKEPPMTTTSEREQEPAYRENARQAMAAILNDLGRNGMTREELEALVGGRVWDTEEMTREFDVLIFSAPYVFVCRKSDRQLGSLLFMHAPRFYFTFREGERP